ncbi:protein CURLY FLAG LEAF 1-like [Musa acuminata AAA Group]|uniref:protein CURLY FLAG LEAF 1-like n=1 Tax=Musa acuminata AAA Group TaxID=214697 RepID=UPI0031D2A621
MVSVQAALSPCADLVFLTKKRKRGDGEDHAEALFAEETKLVKAEEKEEEIELNLDAPLPLDWQRCLDIKSGQIHFYNTRTNRRTSRHPSKLSSEPPPPPPPPPSSRLSLDLDLNLMSPRSHLHEAEAEQMKHGNARNSCMLRTSDEADPGEMVASVCMRCHMLVMMTKASLSCPNCKFVHPPDRSWSALIKPALKLLCCKD